MEWLCDTSPFVTRNHCGPGWSPGLMTFYQIFNFIIFLSYCSISISIYILYLKRKKDLPSPHVFVLFITFILLCGLTHLSEVIVFYWAPYRLFAALSGITGIASATTAYNLPLVVRSLIKLPSREYVHEMNNLLQEEVLRRTLAEQELARRNESLRARVSSLEMLLRANAEKTLEDLHRTNKWIHERNVAMQELNQMLSELEAL